MNKFNDSIILVPIAIAAIFIYGTFFNNSAIVKRKLRKANGKRIRDFQDEEVAKTMGKITYAGKTLIAPLSGRKCVYYHVEVVDSSGKSSRTLVNEEIAADVVIKDGNHYAIIETSLVKSHIIHDAKYRSGFLNDAGKKLENYLKVHGHESTNLLGFNKRIEYKEGILEEGELLAAAGKGKWKTNLEVKIKIPASRVLVISRDEKKPVYFSDDPDTTQSDLQVL